MVGRKRDKNEGEHHPPGKGDWEKEDRKTPLVEEWKEKREEDVDIQGGKKIA